MLKKLRTCLTAVPLAVVMLLAFIPVPADAAYNDTLNHWASSYIDKWQQYGVIRDSNGNFLPDLPITRGEFAYMLDRVMKYQTAAVNKFSDLSREDLNYDAILRANFADVLRGTDDGRVLSENNIKREEAAAMFARAFKLEYSEDGYTSFKDDSEISPYAKGACELMQNFGYMEGMGDGIFSPKTNLTRAQAVTMLDRIAKNMITSPQTVSNNIQGNLVIQQSGVTIGSVTVNGDVYISPGVGSGTASFNGTNITGKVYVLGGGLNSVNFLNGARCLSVEAERTDGEVSIKTDYSTTIQQVNINGGSGQVLLSGNFTAVSSNTAVPRITLSDASISALTINRELTMVEIDQYSNVNDLFAPSDATGSSVINHGSVNKLRINGKNTVSGTGTVKLAEISGSGAECSFTGAPEQINLGASAAAAVDGLSYRNNGNSTQRVYLDNIASNGQPIIQSVSANTAMNTITVTFNKAIYSNLSTASALKNAVSISRSGGNFTALGTYDSVSISGSTLVISLNLGLSGSNSRIRIDAGTVRDSAGNVQQLQLTIPTSYMLSNSGLTITSLSPSAGSANAAVNSALTLTFNKRVSKGSGTRYITIYRSNGTLFESILISSSRVSLSGSTVTITPSGSFTNGDSYYVLIDSGSFVSQTDSGSFAGITSPGEWNFTVSSGGLTVTSYSPANNAANAGTNTSLVMTFNKRPMRPQTNKYIYIYRSGTAAPVETINTLSSAQVSVGTSNSVTITTSNLISGYTYYVLIDDGAFLSYADNDSYNGISSSSVWRFTVGTGGSISIGSSSSPKLGRTSSFSLSLSLIGYSSSDNLAVSSSADLNWTIPATIKGNASSLTITPKTGGLKAGKAVITVSSGTVTATREILISGGTFTLGSVSDKLTAGTVQTAIVTLNNMGTNQTLTAQSSDTSVAAVSITQPSSSSQSAAAVTINPLKAGTFTLTISAPGAANLVKTFTVEGTQTKEIISVDIPQQVFSGIKYGTDLSETAVPAYLSVTIKGQSAKESIPVMWINYDKLSFGDEQVLTGELILPDSYALSSDKAISVTVKVDTPAAIVDTNVAEYSFDISTGQYIGSEPPAVLNLTLENSITIVNVPVTWTLPPNVTGTQQIIGALTLTDMPYIAESIVTASVIVVDSAS